MSGDFCESHCWCLSASTAIFLINLLSPQPACIFRFRLFSYFFPPIFLLMPPSLDHPGSGSLLVNSYPLFNLNPSRPPPRSSSLLGSCGQSATDRLTPDLLLHKCLWKSADIRREAAVSEGSNKLPVVREGIMRDMTAKTCCNQSEIHMESLSSGKLLCMSLKDNNYAY